VAYLQNGYLCVFNGHGRVREGGGTHYPLHRLIYEEAHGVILSRSMVVHHLNEDPLDNRVENLEAVSRAEHPTRHRYAVREGERRCGRCLEWKPLAEFSKGQKRCKLCATISRTEWAATNAPRLAVYNERRREKYARQTVSA
jgi:hypothetical protein